MLVHLAGARVVVNWHYLGTFKSCGCLKRFPRCGQRTCGMMRANSLPMMARRMAGRLGCGGGPAVRCFLRLIFPRPHPAVPDEAQMLQISECNACHQHVPVQPGPRPALEVAETELALHLLVRLLAHPARLNGGCQRTQRSPWR